MHKKALSVLFATSTSVLLGGCFDMAETFTFDGDGMVSVETRIAISTALASLSDAEQPSCQSGDQPWGTGVTVRDYSDGPDRVCEYTGQFTFEAFATELAQRESEDADFGMSIAETDDGYRFQVDLVSSGFMPEQEENELFDTTAMLAAMTAGRAMTWTVVAAEIIATDGVMNDEATEATVSIPLATLMDQEAGIVTRFIEFRTQPRPFWQRLFR